MFLLLYFYDVTPISAYADVTDCHVPKSFYFSDFFNVWARVIFSVFADFLHIANFVFVATFDVS